MPASPKRRRLGNGGQTDRSAPFRSSWGATSSTSSRNRPEGHFVSRDSQGGRQKPRWPQRASRWLNGEPSLPSRPGACGRQPGRRAEGQAASRGPNAVWSSAHGGACPWRRWRRRSPEGHARAAPPLVSAPEVGLATGGNNRATVFGLGCDHGGFAARRGKRRRDTLALTPRRQRPRSAQRARSAGGVPANRNPPDTNGVRNARAARAQDGPAGPSPERQARQRGTVLLARRPGRANRDNARQESGNAAARASAGHSPPPSSRTGACRAGPNAQLPSTTSGGPPTYPQSRRRSGSMHTAQPANRHGPGTEATTRGRQGGWHGKPSSRTLASDEQRPRPRAPRQRRTHHARNGGRASRRNVRCDVGPARTCSPFSDGSGVPRCEIGAHVSRTLARAGPP